MIDGTYLTDIRRTFSNYRTLGERALAQTSDADLFTPIDPDANSIAVIMQHVAGNLRSRFQELLTTDGEKAARDRDAEFEAQPLSREELIARWTGAWEIVCGELDRLRPEDLARTIHIRH